MKIRGWMVGVLMLVYQGISAQFTIATVPDNCYNDCDGQAYITPSTGYRYHWSTGDTVSIIGHLCVGTYTCTVSDTLGTPIDTLSATITQPSQITYSITVDSATCPGAQNGAISISMSGGVRPYYFAVNKLDSGYIFLHDSIFTGLDTGYYHVIISDANECGGFDSAVIGFLSPACTGIKNIPHLKNFSLQPNPAGNITHVIYELNESTALKISLLNITGNEMQQVLNEAAAKGHHSIPINLTALPAGEYILNVVSEQGSFNTPLIKQ